MWQDILLVDREDRNERLWCFDRLQTELLNVACQPPYCSPLISPLSPTLPVPPNSLSPNQSLTRALSAHVYVIPFNSILEARDNDVVPHDVEERRLSAANTDGDIGVTDLDGFKLPDDAGAIDARGEKLDIFLIVGHIDRAGDIQLAEHLPDQKGRVDHDVNRVAGGRVDLPLGFLAGAVGAGVFGGPSSDEDRHAIRVALDDDEAVVRGCDEFR